MFAAGGRTYNLLPLNSSTTNTIRKLREGWEGFSPDKSGPKRSVALDSPALRGMCGGGTRQKEECLRIEVTL